ncbi:MAG TPA: dockerin type I domain-containing protein, partial [Tepidisphaeraceae bacterium]|nr:dockerin type I domain-containing protein [Tepidisphaeraceae bacterium]
EMLVKFTYYGDCNLDGTVDTGPDLSLFAKGFHGQGSGWDFGDFNYDGTANSLDVSLLARGLNNGYKKFGAM